MSSITNINNNSAVVNVGRTTPVSPGQQTADKSIPVVVASDQKAIPVEEQNKIQSEVALSLLGIPRSEVALGIFADVNTYDVNPSEWSNFPQAYQPGLGIKHIPSEAGAIVEATRDNSAVLTSKRFFRYQPGRVSAATFGVKSTVSEADFSYNPVIRKQGIYDRYDGYYWETRQSGKGDNFTVVRRTQSIFQSPITPFGVSGQQLRGANSSVSDQITITQTDDYRVAGKAPNGEIEELTRNLKERKLIVEERFALAEAAWTESMLDAGFASYYNELSASAQATFKSKCQRDVDYWIDMYLMDLALTPTGGSTLVDAHTAINTHNYGRGNFSTGYHTSVAVENRAAPYEIILYQALLDVVQGNDAASTSTIVGAVDSNFLTALTTLITITKDFFTKVDDEVTYPNVNGVFEGYTQPTNWGQKNPVETVFDARKHYWAYYVAEYDNAGTAVTYDADLVPPSFTLADIKYKCQRDQIYVIEGYRDDLSGGGNATTKYNASMYLKGTGLSIYTQVESDGTTPTEVARHTFLKDLIKYDIDNSSDWYGNDISSYSTTFFNGSIGAGTGLANIIIRNFNVEDITSTVYGDKPVAGNLAILRDGLIMTHAAVFDPTLMKDKKRIRAVLNATDNTVKITDGIVTFGQHVKFFGTDNGDLVNGKIYQVKTVVGPKGNTFLLKDSSSGADISITSDVGPTSNAAYFETVVPFIFPDEYDPAKYLQEQVYNGIDPYPAGTMFPLMYTIDGALPNVTDTTHIGYVDSALATETQAGNDKMKTQIDEVNFIPEYINWIKNNVKPEYYGVYEYRVPRSRFSTDQLNGEADNPTVYSDVAVGTGGRVRPGQTVLDDLDNPVTTDSVYDFDFTKVTMQKIEFSWYGAVGALFLAYVPVGNGDARWVRVHHLRASNQLKIASLGNATLPITYTVYGGGSDNARGDGEVNTHRGYGTNSHHIVKYGASYYIDGGDRGTVRLYSHTNDFTEKVYGRVLDLGTVTYVFDSALGLYYVERTPGAGEPENVYFMNAACRTNNRVDNIINVVWATSTRLYLSGQPSSTALRLLHKRSNTVFGLETKREILSTQFQKVRNRVQVYPVRMSTINLGNDPIRLTALKTPIFQTDFDPASNTFELDADYVITETGDELPVDSAYSSYMADGDETYGWFLADIALNNVIDRTTVFGRLHKLGNSYYFEMLEYYDGTVTLKSGSFLRDERFDTEGNIITSLSKVTEEKEGLSSIIVASDSQVPIPNTGVSVATLYLNSGTDQFDLDTYFDYNKEYLSFPLTDVTETLYFQVDNEDIISASNITSTGNVSIGVTWEEQ